MRLLPRRYAPGSGDAERAVGAAVAAGAEAAERLASASKVRAGADAQAAREKHTIVSDIRAMRQRNHLADLILESVRGGKP
jgi:hypothetical protein